MIIKTKSGSTYEIDTLNRLIRRLSGTHPATNRQGNDGEWKSYTVLLPFENYGLFIDYVGNGSGTMTSPVVSHTQEELLSLLT